MSNYDEGDYSPQNVAFIHTIFNQLTNRTLLEIGLDADGNPLILGDYETSLMINFLDGVSNVDSLGVSFKEN